MANTSLGTIKPSDHRSKSCETACSSNCSCFFQRRKPMNPLAASLRGGLIRTAPTNAVNQRVLSAKLLKVKSLQNQLNDANYHLSEAIRENKALKNLQRRQDRALTKYEGDNAELPRLIKSHEEEIRFLTEKNKQLRKSVRELNEQLKHRNDELLVLAEQVRRFEDLDKDKRLFERAKLADELDDYKIKLAKADEQIVVLNRKLALEAKTSKQKLGAETGRLRDCQKELTRALSELMKLTKAAEGKEHEPGVLQLGKKRFSGLLPRQSASLCTLDRPASEVKLAPLKGILKCPSERVKARLASASSGGSPRSEAKTLSRQNSAVKLDKIEHCLQSTIKKAEESEHSDEMGKKLGDYCLQAIDSVKSCGGMIDDHRENIKIVETDTDLLLASIKEVDQLEKKMNAKAKGDGAELDFVTQILSEELDFQRKYKDRNGNVDAKVKEQDVSVNDKKKLLATLRAIDNGEDESVVSFDETGAVGVNEKRKNQLMMELFGGE